MKIVYKSDRDTAILVIVVYQSKLDMFVCK